MALLAPNFADPHLMPQTEREAAEMIAAAYAEARPLNVQGANTRGIVFSKQDQPQILSSKAISGITLYEPSEMVIGAHAGTALAEVVALLASKGQRLAFEPAAYWGARLKDQPERNQKCTIGAVAAMNISGSRRIMVGAARDSLIGVRFINGMGEIIKNGGRVMKNVTGLDLVKLMAGAFGTLGLLTEVTFKVSPIPEASYTLRADDLSVEKAVALMSAALGSPFEITGAAHVPQAATMDGAAHASATSHTYLRIEGFETSLIYRAGELQRHLRDHAKLEVMKGAATDRLWAEINTGEVLAPQFHNALWRISVKPSDAPALMETLRQSIEYRAFYDWGGGLIYLEMIAPNQLKADTLRSKIAAISGHAQLIHAPENLSDYPRFQPQSSTVMALQRQVKAQFDPKGIFNKGLLVS